MLLSCCQVLVSHREADPAHFAVVSERDLWFDCQVLLEHCWGCGQVVKYIQTYSYLYELSYPMIRMVFVKSLRLEALTYVGQDNFYLSDHNDQALDYQN